MAIKIPKFVKTEEYTIEDAEGKEHIIIIGEYKAIDMPIVLKIEQLQLELPGLIAKAQFFKDVLKPVWDKIKEDEDVTEETLLEMLVEEGKKYKEEDFSPKDIEDIKNAIIETDELKAETDLLYEKLAQRGLKRYYFKKEDDYKEADRNDRLTEYLDSLEDIPMPVNDLRNIAQIMLKLGAPSRKLRKVGMGKREKTKPLNKK